MERKNYLIEGLSKDETAYLKSIIVNTRKRYIKDNYCYINNQCVSMEEVEDDAIMNSGRNKIKAFFEKEDLRLEEFDEEIFETLVHKAIIGEVKDNGEKNPYVINFVFKSGFEYDKIKTKTDSLISSEEVLILQYDSFQNFVSFDK